MFALLLLFLKALTVMKTLALNTSYRIIMKMKLKKTWRWNFQCCMGNVMGLICINKFRTEIYLGGGGRWRSGAVINRCVSNQTHDITVNSTNHLHSPVLYTKSNSLYSIVSWAWYNASMNTWKFNTNTHPQHTSQKSLATRTYITLTSTRISHNLSF